MTAKPTFFDIRNKIMGWDGLSLSTRVLWEQLCQMAWADGSCYPSTQALARMLQISLITVKRSKAELIQKKIIHVFRRRHPQTDVFFPFVKFRNIEQRDKNITVLSSVSQTLPDSNKNDDLQEGSVSQTPRWCLTDTISSVSQTPIKENSLKENIKEEEDNTTNVVFCQTCHQNDKSDTIDMPVEPQTEAVEQPKLTKKQRSEKHRESRENQIAEIEANLKQYRDEYPAINIDLQLQKMRLWLDTNPKGKTRKDIHRTWANWLLKAQSNYNVAQVGKQTPENKRLSQYEEYKKYVAKNNNR
jgi:hypothetical protein